MTTTKTMPSRPTTQLACCRRTSVNGAEQLVFETPAGQRITLQDGPGLIVVQDSNGNSVTLEAGGITINAAVKISLNASQLEISAATLTVNAGMTTFSGVVQADKIITNQLINAPGSGNVW
jgi:hypothetical protein